MPHAVKRRLPLGVCVRQYEAGASIETIARAAGVTRQSMWDSLRRAGVRMRPRERYGAENHFYRGGGRKVEADGRVRVYVRGRWFLEHRRIMERVLGRPLRADEDVRWKNGDRGDNRPENLEVLPHGEHTRQVHAGKSIPPAAVARRRDTMAARYGLGDPEVRGRWRELRWFRRQPAALQSAYLRACGRFDPPIPKGWRSLFEQIAGEAAA